MSEGIRIEVEGFEELKRKIRALRDDKSKKRELLGLLRQIAKPTLTAAQNIVPVQKSRSNLKSRKSVVGGRLKRSLGMINGRKGNAVENPTVYVGPRARNGYEGWYGHMVEAGHAIYRNPSAKGRYGQRNKLARLRRKGLNSKSGFVEGRFFLKKAYQATNGTVTPDAEKKVARYIQRKIDRL